MLDSRWKNPQGKTPEALWRWAQDLIGELRKSTYLSGLTGSVEDLESSKADKDQVIFGSWLIETPEDKDYRLIVNSPYAVTWTDVTTIATAGTATATVKIGSTPLGGSANSVSTSEDTQTHDSDNEMGAGDDLVLTISASNNCEGLSITIAGTTELATQ